MYNEREREREREREIQCCFNKEDLLINHEVYICPCTKGKKVHSREVKATQN
jgi:DNA repair protein RadC